MAKQAADKVEVNIPPVVVSTNDEAKVIEPIPFSQPTEPAFIPEKSTVQVTQEELAGMMGRLNSLEADNKRLLEAVDRSRLSKIDARNAAGVPLIPEMKVSQFRKDGPLVIAWKMTRNDSFMDGNKAVENQRVEVFYEDGTQEEMPLIAFVRNRIKDVVGEVVSRSKEEGADNESVVLRLPDGRKITIGLAYVN